MDQNNYQPNEQNTNTSTNPAESVQPPTNPQQPAPNQQAPFPAHNPGETLGVISIIMTVPLGLSLVGLILGVLSRKRSQEVGASTTLGTVGIVLGAIGTAVVTLGIIAFFALIALSGAARSNSNNNSDLFNDSESSSSTL